MQQLNLFNNDIKPHKSTTFKKVGKPKTITSKQVYCTIESIKNKDKTDITLKKCNISRRTYFRIKKGDYNDLLKEYLDNNIDNFYLDFSL